MNQSEISKDLLLAVLGGLIAAGINLFRLPLFFEAEFLFGPAIVLLVAIFRGPLAGLIASIIATVPVIMAWGSFWAMLTFGLEALFVAIICTRWHINVILVVMAYWLFIGMPVSWYSISQYELFLDSHRTSILIKQLTNAILYAHVTALVMFLPAVRNYLTRVDDRKPISIKEQSSHIIASLLITVGILFFFFNLNQNIKISSEKFNQIHDTKHDKLTAHLKLMVENKLTAMNELKYNISHVWNDKDARQEVLLEFNDRHPEFRTMIIANANADLLHSSPPELVINVLSQNETINVKDRDYFINAIDSNQVYVSPGFVGRGFGSDLISAVSVGIPDPTNPEVNIGIVEGSFILSSMKAMKELIDNIDESVDGILFDQYGQAIIASRQLFLQPLETIEFSKGVDQFYEHNLVNMVRSNGTKEPGIYYSLESDFAWGWKLVTLQNEAKFADVIETVLITFAVSIVLVVLVAKLLAWAISNSWSYHMQRLNEMIEQGVDFNNDLVEFEENDHLPEEVSNLYQEIKRSKQKIITMNQELQNTVAERTEKLQVANEKLNVMAREDELTKLDNRRVFNETLNQLYQQCQKELLPLSMMIIDIDHFKKVNDSYGHPAGDEVLIFLAQVLQQYKHKPVQSVSRIGGEEFCLLLKGRQHEQAFDLAEDIRKRVESIDFKVGADKTIQLTISIGLASINPTKFTAAKLYQLADTALYEAKHSGRNQVKNADFSG